MLHSGHDAKPVGTASVARHDPSRSLSLSEPFREPRLKTPPRLLPLVEDGLVDEVVRQLKSGKEAMVFVVLCGGEARCAKVYKEADKRGFRQSVSYTEGRKVKNSRQARAMEKGSRYGRKEQEAAWQHAEVDALYRLAGAGVRVPKPYNFHEGVLLMELVTDAEGNAAPRLEDLALTAEQALAYHAALIRQVVLMLCAGVVHGDLSAYNILVDADGPVIIDLPQAIDAAGNNHAKSMLVRDVNNLAAFFGQFVPEILPTDYGHEIWALYAAGALRPDSELTGTFVHDEAPADVDALMRDIDAVVEEEADRRRRLADLG